MAAAPETVGRSVLSSSKPGTFISRSSQETLHFGYVFGNLLKPGCVVGLTGDLGAGKTVFAKGIARAASGIDESSVTSPTFTIVQEYAGSVTLYHCDAYRISGPEELASVGLDDYIRGDAIVIIEWADRILQALPDDCLFVRLCYSDRSEHERILTCSATGVTHRAVLQRACERVARFAQDNAGFPHAT